ncbi:putative RNA methyltransferase [Alteromonas sp. C1M14]|uniref:putative RNA methyltransferase n=1 Tax=Alteromonas sp. C1M14 TaxID=2841567 RepID=UPI001C0A39A4|nr:methyltransferase domain-containing protein [Alteromonas sp. C1M14]MBU2976946.1 methyltransferase domain-containing protein [Alteromonas sp. C1M14]
MWLCPLCKSPLSEDGPWCCDKGHSFDVSRSGYVNLLPVQKKKSKQPGDNKDMIAARQQFHQRAGFLPLMENMGALIDAHVSARSVTLFDAGCGEGTYLSSLQSQLQKKGTTVQAAGSDISKAAIDIASKQYKNAQFVVASSFDLPVATASIDILLQVFAPGDDKTLARVLKDDGMLLHVAPGPDHLMALKKEAYATPRPHQLPEETRTGLTLVQRERLAFPINLTDPEMTMALVNMTPFTWKFNDEQRNRLVQDMKTVHADFILSVWKKSSAVPV